MLTVRRDAGVPADTASYTANQLRNSETSACFCWSETLSASSAIRTEMVWPSPHGHQHAHVPTAGPGADTNSNTGAGETITVQHLAICADGGP